MSSWFGKNSGIQARTKPTPAGPIPKNNILNVVTYMPLNRGGGGGGEINIHISKINSDCLNIEHFATNKPANMSEQNVFVLFVVRSIVNW